MCKELNCVNCCIGNFKESLCDCNNGICKEYKKVGSAEDFENEVMNRTKPKTGKWIEVKGYDGDIHYQCDQCGNEFILIDGTPKDNNYNYCPNCGSRMDAE